MTVSFNADSGQLRLDQSTFDRLVAWSGGDTADDEQLAQLRHVGVIGPDGRAHPVVVAAMQAVTDYVCQLRVDLTDEQGVEKTGDGWISWETATLLLDIPGDVRELVALPPTLVPGAIARVTRLGPHPSPGSEPLHMTREVFDGLLSPDETERRAAADQLAIHTSQPPLPGIVDRLVAGPWRYWSATMAWYTPQSEPASSTLQVLDTDACLCLCEVSGNDATLWPTNATGVWRRLTLLLPDEVEGG